MTLCRGILPLATQGDVSLVPSGLQPVSATAQTPSRQKRMPAAKKDTYTMWHRRISGTMSEPAKSIDIGGQMLLGDVSQ